MASSTLGAGVTAMEEGFIMTMFLFDNEFYGMALH